MENRCQMDSKYNAPRKDWPKAPGRNVHASPIDLRNRKRLPTVLGMRCDGHVDQLNYEWFVER